MRYYALLYIKRLQKYQRSKLEVNKKIRGSAWPLIFLQTLDKNENLVPHLKDTIHIYYEPENQGMAWLWAVISMSQITPKMLHKMQIDTESFSPAVIRKKSWQFEYLAGKKIWKSEKNSSI